MPVTFQKCCAEFLPSTGQHLVFVLLRRIDENESRDLFRVFSCEYAHVIATERVPHQNIRSPFTRSLQQTVQFCGNPRAGAWHRASITAAVTSSIVRTHSGKPGNSRLYRFPFGHHISKSAFQYDRRAARTSAVDLKPVTADIY